MEEVTWWWPPNPCAPNQVLAVSLGGGSLGRRGDGHRPRQQPLVNYIMRHGWRRRGGGPWLPVLHAMAGGGGLVPWMEEEEDAMGGCGGGGGVSD
jgi:hypothetical protein